MKYKVIKFADQKFDVACSKLEVAVEEHLQAGWCLVGGVSISSMSGWSFICQAVQKP